MEKNIKKILEENLVSLATTDSNGNPHAIVVAYVKIQESRLIIAMSGKT